MFGPREAPADYGALCDEFRCHTTEWVGAERDRVVREQRRLRVRELALTRVLDERGQVDDSLAQADGVSIRQVRDTIATARALEDLPQIARVAASGALSSDQLTQVVKVAEPGNAEDDHRWAVQASSWSPSDLAQQARLKRTPTIDESHARRAARELRWWWRADNGMLDGRFSLPDVDGAAFETLLNRLVEGMRPAKGQPWESREHRGADALMHLVRGHDRRDDPTTGPATASPAPLFIVQVPPTGPATVAGIPLPDQMVERLRANARIEPVLVDDHGEPVAVGRTESVLSEKKKRVVRQRDGKCRIPGCDWRHHLEVHHLWPRSWGGSDDLSNLAAVCPKEHPDLVPHGPWLLLGNPNHPNGLVRVHIDDLPALAQLAAAEARAGPEAA